MCREGNEGKIKGGNVRSPCAPVVALILKAFGHCCAMCAGIPHCAALAGNQQRAGFSAHCGLSRHEPRRRFPPPARPHPLARQPAGAADHHPGARRRAAGRRPCLAPRPDRRAGPLDLRPWPGGERARDPSARPPIAPGHRQGARGPAWRPRPKVERPGATMRPRREIWPPARWAAASAWAMIGNARWLPRERMRPGRMRKSSSRLMARGAAMCGKPCCFLLSGVRRTLRGSRAHCTAMPKSLENQGHNRGAGAPHIAALYLALRLSPSERQPFLLPPLRNGAREPARARASRSLRTPPEERDEQAIGRRGSIGHDKPGAVVGGSFRLCVGCRATGGRRRS